MGREARRGVAEGRAEAGERTKGIERGRGRRVGKGRMQVMSTFEARHVPSAMKPDH